MRALGIDLGSKRIGLALSDPSGTIASAHSVVPRSGSRRRDHQAVKAVVDAEGVEVVVVGLPLNMNGTRGPAADAAENEARQLSTVVGVPVTMVDERRTTVSADQAMIAAGLRAPDRRKVVDKVAAAIMLQHWLDQERR